MRSLLDLATTRLTASLAFTACLAATSLALAAPSRPAPTPVTLTGQVVCSGCWLEADRAVVPYGGKGDLDCAVRCEKKGIPPALAVRAEDTGVATLYLLEGARPPGNEGHGWLDFVGGHATVTGTVRKLQGKRHLTPLSFTPLNTPTATAATAPNTPTAPTAQTSPAAPAQPPDLELVDLDGKRQRLSELRGQVVVLNFWATWCPPCRAEIPVLVAAEKTFSARGVRFVAATADGDADRVRRFAAANHMTFPIWLSASGSELRRFGLDEQIPATVIVDRAGNIAWRHPGPLATGVIDAALKPLLATSPESH